MVQKYQSPVRVYKHPFELIMAVSTCVSVYTGFLLRLKLDALQLPFVAVIAALPCCLCDCDLCPHSSVFFKIQASGTANLHVCVVATFLG